MKKSPFRAGFTLIELLIVIAIIGILAGLLSTAIMKLTKTAVDKRNKNNAERLEAAIVEYWHDMGRWPIDKNAKPVLKEGKGRALTGSAEAASNTSITTYTYEMSFRENNDAVVGFLLDATLPDGTRKNFLDLNGFSTPVESSVSTWPVREVVDARLAYRGEATDDSGQAIPARKKPVLVYFAPFIKCPHCETYYPLTGSRNFCTNDDCKYWNNNSKRYRFSKAEKRRPYQFAQPFKIVFDFQNNVVDVSAP
jgi:prepilin-type N-terminal cleavage/methylation domain-containing protein